MKKNLIKTAIIIIFAFLFTQCSFPGSLIPSQGTSSPTVKTPTKVPTNTVTPTPTRTKTPTATSTPTPEIEAAYTSEELQSAIEAISLSNQKFSFGIFQSLAPTKGNLFFSPYAIHEGLLLISAGSQGTTKSEIDKTLGLDLPSTIQNDANKTILEKIKRSPDQQKKETFEFRENFYNTVWIQSGYVFLPYFNSLAINYYGSGVNIINLMDSQETNRQVLNQFINIYSAKKVDNVVQAGELNSDFQLLLTSASYFESPWENYFDIKLTANQPFKNLDGSSKDVETMQRFYRFSYAKMDNLEAIEIPYKGQKQSMLIILPQEGQYQAVEKSLDYNRYKEITNSLAFRDVNLVLPKFKFSTGQSVGNALKTLGINAMFNDKAEFPNMVGNGAFKFGLIAEKSVFMVDEFGTQVQKPDWPWVSLWKNVKQYDVELKVNRPFIVIVRDNETGEILYLGRVLDPSVE